MAIYLTNDDVLKLLPIGEAVEVLDDLFKQEAQGLVENVARIRRKFEGGGSATLMGGSVLGSKAYGVRNQILSTLFNSETGAVEALLEPSAVAWIRTGAASGLATKYMAKEGASTVGVVGTGRQAITQLEAICAVRPIRSIKTYSRSQDRREQFARQMSDLLGVKATSVNSPEECLKGSEIVVAITNSAVPVFDGNQLEPGTHVNAAGANSYARCEVDEATIVRSSLVVVDNLAQAQTECGELMAAAVRGVFRWGQAIELHQVVGGEVNGRPSVDGITLFESQGIGIEDVACYAYVVKKAHEQGIGQELPF